jgi:integrase
MTNAGSEGPHAGRGDESAPTGLPQGKKQMQDDETVGISIHVPRAGHASIMFSNGCSITFPDEAWPRAIKVIREEWCRPPDGLRTPAAAAPMKYTVQQINRLIERIRSDQPPKLPEGKREKHYHDPALTGFYIRLLDTGVASWVLQYKRLGRQKKITVGDVKVVDRLDAIKTAKDLLAKVQLEMLDPHEARRERMRAARVTFATVVPLFMEHKKNQGLKRSTEKAWNRYFTKYHFKPLHNHPIDEITVEQLQTQIDIIASQSGNRTAADCCTAMNVLFKWAISKRKLPTDHHNPMNNVQAPPRNPPRERVLSDDEIRLIWKALDAWEVLAIQDQQFKETTGKKPGNAELHNPDAPRAIKLLFLTGCRAQEIGGLQRSEVEPLDNAELFIPGSRRKSRKKQEHAMNLHVPLADWAVQILRGVAKRPNNDLVFGRGRKVSGLYLVGCDTRVDRQIIKAGGIPPRDWSLHDIRRTFRTKMAQLGVTPDVAEALVGHVGHRTEMDRIYNRYEYWPEKKLALAKWQDHLRAIIDGTAEKIARPNFGQRKGGAA